MIDDIRDLKFFLLAERKDHLIKKLSNLSASEKEQVIAFFHEKPNLENKINWNNKKLTFADFKEVMATTKTERKRKVSRRGIAGLKKGEDYIPLTTPSGVMDAYIPLHWEASKLIASHRVGGCEGKWCTATSKSPYFWRNYVSNRRQIPIYFIGDKIKFAAMIQNGKLHSFWDKQDQELPKIDVNMLGFNGLSEFNSFLKKNQSKFITAKKKLKMGHWLIDGIKNGKIQVENADYIIRDDKDANSVLWRGGIWLSGVWEGGTWQDGTWKDGTWKEGTWVDGTWENGYWEGGTWEDGVWKNGIWENGLWKFGTWEDGTWENGTWKNGGWEDGTWENGTWDDGAWQKGVWEKGIWRDGIWVSGTWENGVWESGEFRGGIWKKGVWMGPKDQKPKGATREDIERVMPALERKIERLQWLMEKATDHE